jgi:hypothetical protein
MVSFGLAKSKLALGIVAFLIGVPALAFALFGWSQAAHPLLGDYSRYLCIIGGLGAMISGTLILRENWCIKHARTLKEPTLEFQVIMHEEQQTVTA